MSPSIKIAWPQSSKGKRWRPSPAAVAKALEIGQSSVHKVAGQSATSAHDLGRLVEIPVFARFDCRALTVAP